MNKAEAVATLKSMLDGKPIRGEKRAKALTFGIQALELLGTKPYIMPIEMKEWGLDKGKKE